MNWKILLFVFVINFFLQNCKSQNDELTLIKLFHQIDKLEFKFDRNLLINENKLLNLSDSIINDCLYIKGINDKNYLCFTKLYEIGDYEIYADIKQDLISRLEPKSGTVIQLKLLIYSTRKKIGLYLKMNNSASIYRNKEDVIKLKIGTHLDLIDPEKFILDSSMQTIKSIQIFTESGNIEKETERTNYIIKNLNNNKSRSIVFDKNYLYEDIDKIILMESE